MAFSRIHVLKLALNFDDTLCFYTTPLSLVCPTTYSTAGKVHSHCGPSGSSDGVTDALLSLALWLSVSRGYLNGAAMGAGLAWRWQKLAWVQFNKSMWQKFDCIIIIQCDRNTFDRIIIHDSMWQNLLLSPFQLFNVTELTFECILMNYSSISYTIL